MSKSEQLAQDFIEKRKQRVEAIGRIEERAVDLETAVELSDRILMNQPSDISEVTGPRQLLQRAEYEAKVDHARAVLEAAKKALATVEEEMSEIYVALKAEF